jgi:hypothetical protein
MNEVTRTPLLKACDVAKYLNVSRTEAYRLMGKDLPVVRFGTAIVRVRLCDLEEFIQKRLSNGR